MNDDDFAFFVGRSALGLGFVAIAFSIKAALPAVLTDFCVQRVAELSVPAFVSVAPAAA